MGLISGLISAITSPRLGSLSDRYGRRWIICFSCAGLLTSEITTILVVKFHTLPVSLLLVGALVDGICGSFMLAMALSYSYGADCTLPTKRAMAFGAFQGCLFSGMAIGPVLGGLVVEATGSILSIFYAAVVTHLVFMIYIVLILPESVSPRRMKLSKERYQNEMHRAAASGIGKWNNLNPKNLFRPLGILFPTGVGSSPRLRLNLVLLAAIDSTLFGVAMGGMTVIIMYAERMFHWRNLDVRISYHSIPYWPHY